jgi:predicted RNA-binding protein
VGVEGEDLGSKVAFAEIENGRLLLKTLLGEQEGIRADIKELDFLSHYIIMENPRRRIQQKGV